MYDFCYIEKYSKERNVKLDFTKFCDTMKQKRISSQCPLCHHADFVIKHIKIHTEDFSECMTYDDCEIMPLVAVICKNCGYTAFINPMIIDCLIER